MIDGGGNAFLSHYLALFNLNHLSSLLVDMGPAVLNGGLSTLIAFILLLSSDSHVFSSFFKIFMLVVLFGVSFQWQRRCFYHRCFPREQSDTLRTYSMLLWKFCCEVANKRLGIFRKCPKFEQQPSSLGQDDQCWNFEVWHGLILLPVLLSLVSLR